MRSCEGHLRNFFPGLPATRAYVLHELVQSVPNASASPEAQSHHAEDFIDRSFLEELEARSLY
jgi:hypothetical protein